jgi:serine/threonine protein kinase
MHCSGVIHGDLKASNVLVDESHICRLADFGLATVLYNSPADMSTVAGGTHGTIRWMAPGSSRLSR